MKLQKLYSYVRRALQDYQMIKDGDTVAIGISGGKDSLTLLYALAGLRQFYPEHFEIKALTVNLGYNGFDTSKIKDLCRSLNVEYTVIDTKINEMLENGQCSLCSRLRKGALTDEAIRLGCNKIAYAHNLDDVVETLLLSLIYEGRLSTFYPVTHFEDNNIDIIRPLMYVPVEDVIGFSNKYMLPISKNPCPYDSTTKRSYVRGLIKDINAVAPDVKKRMMTAIMNGHLDGWERS